MYTYIHIYIYIEREREETLLMLLCVSSEFTAPGRAQASYPEVGKKVLKQMHKLKYYKTN